MLLYILSTYVRNNIDDRYHYYYTTKCVRTHLQNRHTLAKMGNSARHLKPEAVSDLENATEFTADEIKDYYKRFMGTTAHGSMTLSHDEFVAAYGRLFPKGDAKSFAEHVFRLYDRDGSGHIGNYVCVTTRQHSVTTSSVMCDVIRSLCNGASTTCDDAIDSVNVRRIINV